MRKYLHAFPIVEALYLGNRFSNIKGHMHRALKPFHGLVNEVPHRVGSEVADLSSGPRSPGASPHGHQCYQVTLVLHSRTISSSSNNCGLDQNQE